jgi:hypothetical protein
MVEFQRTGVMRLAALTLATGMSIAMVQNPALAAEADTAARPTDCHSNVVNITVGTALDLGSATCLSGTGRVRVRLECSAGYRYTKLGPWVGIGQRSRAYCNHWAHRAVSAGYNTIS